MTTRYCNCCSKYRPEPTFVKTLIQTKGKTITTWACGICDGIRQANRAAVIAARKSKTTERI